MTMQQHVELKPEHLDAIHSLADETHQPLAEVNQLYVEVFEELDAEARVKDFVTLFTARQVCDRLRGVRPHA
ncbi:MAG: DUF3562 domain-containing protein [Pseudomonadota bacterium]